MGRYTRWDDADYWGLLYTGGYEATLPGRRFGLRRDRLVAEGLVAPGRRVLVAGCAYGHLVCLLREGGAEATGIDASAYISRRRRRHSPCPDLIAKDDLLTHIGTYDAVVTDDMISSFMDDERPLVYAACDRLAPVTVHFVSCGASGDTSFVWKSLGAWRQDNPHHLFYEANGDG